MVSVQLCSEDGVSCSAWERRAGQGGDPGKGGDPAPGKPALGKVGGVGAVSRAVYVAAWEPHPEVGGLDTTQGFGFQ